MRLNVRFASPASALQSILPALAALSLVTSLSAATPREVGSQNTPVRDHHLFVGVDLFLRHDNEMVAVRNIVRDQALLDLPTPESFSLRRSSGLQMKMATKVSDIAAIIDNLESKRHYSPGNDPVAQQMSEQMQVQSVLADQAAINQQSQRQLSEQASAAAATAENGASPQIRAEAATASASINNQLNEAAIELNQVESLLSSDLFDFGGIDDGDEKFDSVRISFKVSSATPMAKAYVVALLRVESSNSLHDVSFYEHIGQVNSKPRKVTLAHHGFPPGFKIKETQVFLFNYGEEIPTNLSDKHYQLTAAEAREFVILDRQGLNRRASVPAKPAWEFAPVALRSSKNPQDFNYAVTIDLDETGQLLAIKSDNQIVPEQVRAVLLATTFLPALENGKPIASTLTINPIDFFKE
jgi:hypothetical protein